MSLASVSGKKADPHPGFRQVEDSSLAGRFGAALERTHQGGTEEIQTPLRQSDVKNASSRTQPGERRELGLANDRGDQKDLGIVRRIVGGKLQTISDGRVVSSTVLKKHVTGHPHESPLEFDRIGRPLEKSFQKPQADRQTATGTFENAKTTRSHHLPLSSNDQRGNARTSLPAAKTAGSNNRQSAVFADDLQDRALDNTENSTPKNNNGGDEKANDKSGENGDADTVNSESGNIGGSGGGNINPPASNANPEDDPDEEARRQLLNQAITMGLDANATARFMQLSPDLRGAFIQFNAESPQFPISEGILECAHDLANVLSREVSSDRALLQALGTIRDNPTPDVQLPFWFLAPQVLTTARELLERLPLNMRTLGALSYIVDALTAPPATPHIFRTISGALRRPGFEGEIHLSGLYYAVVGLSDNRFVDTDEFLRRVLVLRVTSDEAFADLVEGFNTDLSVEIQSQETVANLASMFEAAVMGLDASASFQFSQLDPELRAALIYLHAEMPEVNFSDEGLISLRQLAALLPEGSWGGADMLQVLRVLRINTTLDNRWLDRDFFPVVMRAVQNRLELLPPRNRNTSILESIVTSLTALPASPYTLLMINEVLQGPQFERYIQLPRMRDAATGLTDEPLTDPEEYLERILIANLPRAEALSGLLQALDERPRAQHPSLLSAMRSSAQSMGLSLRAANRFSQLEPQLRAVLRDFREFEPEVRIYGRTVYALARLASIMSNQPEVPGVLLFALRVISKSARPDKKWFDQHFMHVVLETTCDLLARLPASERNEAMMMRIIEGLIVSPANVKTLMEISAMLKLPDCSGRVDPSRLADAAIGLIHGRPADTKMFLKLFLVDGMTRADALDSVSAQSELSPYNTLNEAERQFADEALERGLKMPAAIAFARVTAVCREALTAFIAEAPHLHITDETIYALDRLVSGLPEDESAVSASLDMLRTVRVFVPQDSGWFYRNMAPITFDLAHDLSQRFDLENRNVSPDQLISLVDYLIFPPATPDVLQTIRATLQRPGFEGQIVLGQLPDAIMGLAAGDSADIEGFLLRVLVRGLSRAEALAEMQGNDPS